MTTVTIDGSRFRDALDELLGDFHTMAAQALDAGVDAAAKDAFSTTLFQDHTHKLREGTKATVSNRDFKGKLVNATPYARFIEYGTKAHVIRPRKAKILRWYSHASGGWAFAKVVHHPGTKPRPFFKHAGEVGGRTIYNTLAHLTEQNTTRFNRAA